MGGLEALMLCVGSEARSGVGDDMVDGSLEDGWAIRCAAMCRGADVQRWGKEVDDLLVWVGSG